jgi:AraC-like DNA-binding protein
MYNFNNTIEPLWITRSHCEKDMEVKSHTHDHYYHMVYVIMGCFEFNINGKLYALGENMFTIAKPGDFQSWKNTQEKVVETYEVKFSVFDNFLKDALDKLPDIIYGNLFTKTLLEKIAGEKKMIDPNYQEYISIYLNTLLYDMVRMEMANRSEEPKNVSRRNPTQIAIEYIQENYRRELSLEKIAEATYFNKSYLSTTFKKVEGITLNDFIYKYRTYKACELIAYSDLQLAQVSEMVGFKRIQHFNRMFKKYIGIPPGEYRSATPKAFINYDEKDHKFNIEVLPVRSGRVYEVDSDTGYYRDQEPNK